MFTDTDVLDVMRTIVEKYGDDHTYPRFYIDPDDFEDEDEYEAYLIAKDAEGEGGSPCHYRWTEFDVARAKIRGTDIVKGEPACLVGMVLAELNLLDDYVAYPFSAGNTLPIETLLVATGMPQHFDERAKNVLRQAQNCQDRGEAWGYALAKAEEE